MLLRNCDWIFLTVNDFIDVKEHNNNPYASKVADVGFNSG